MPIWKRFWGVLFNKTTNKKSTKRVKDLQSSSSSRDSKTSIIKRIGLAFTNNSGSRTDFEGPEGFDLDEVEKAYNTEAYVRQAIDKYVDLMFKAGWDIVGKNQNAVDYVKLRMGAIAEATRIPTKQLLIDIAEDLVLYHNVFIVKARQSGSYTFPSGITAQGLDNLQPVVGYFPLPSTTVTIARDSKGTIKKYQQEVSGGDTVEIKTDNMIHMHIDKPKGRAFGVPFLWQTLDDIKLLRQVEELVARLIYKDIFPLYQYQVGLAQTGYESTDEEIEEIRDQISDLQLDGGIVLPERHNISVVGAQGKALDAHDYLKYFEQRVFTGLGVSETMMGRGDTANYGTAENMTAEMHDRIKAYQSQMAMYIDEFMFNEILREGGFDPLLSPDDAVRFQFKEIDIDNKIKVENQSIQKFTNNAITHEELRMELGMDPVSDEARLYFNMISTADAEAAANTVDNQAEPKNQNSEESLTRGRFEESQKGEQTLECGYYSKDLQRYWELTQADIINIVKQYYLNRDKKFPDSKPKGIEGTLKLTKDSMMRASKKYITAAFSAGVQEVENRTPYYKSVNVNYASGIKELTATSGESISKLLDRDLSHLLSRALESSDKKQAVLKVVGAFNALNYRLKFIAKSEAYRAYNHGFAKAAMSLGYTHADVSVGDTGCEVCEKMAKTRIKLSAEMKDIPPFHPNCTCTLKLTNLQRKEGQDEENE